MAILLLAPTLPSPRTGGGSVRMHHLVRFLGERFDVDLVTPHRGEPDAEAEPLRRWCRRVDRVPPAPGAGRRRLLRLGPYTVDPALAGTVRERLETGDHVAIQAEKAAMLPYVPSDAGLPLVLDIWAYGLVGPWRDLLREPGLATRARNLLRLVRFAAFDAFCWPDTHRVLLVSEHDRRRCARQRPDRELMVVPNGVDCDVFTPGPVHENGPPVVLFTGDMGFAPNVGAARRLARRIFPAVRERHPDAELWLVGRDPAPRVRELDGGPVTVTGEVPEMLPYLHRAWVYAAPMESGAGTCTKIFEALAAARPVVATAVGMEGIAARPGQSCRIAEDDREIAAIVSDLVADPEERRRMGTAARALAEERYDWESCLAPLEPLYRDLHAAAGDPADAGVDGATQQPGGSAPEQATDGRGAGGHRGGGRNGRPDGPEAEVPP